MRGGIWHWHTPNEHVMIVSGAATLQMKDAKAVSLQAGAFALMPSHHVHQFRCLRTRALYIYSDVAFDIHLCRQARQRDFAGGCDQSGEGKSGTEMK